MEQSREEAVRWLIERFGGHPIGNMLLEDFEKSGEVSQFGRELKDLITEMGNTEIFEFCETSSKRQCPDCAAYWEIGIVILHMRKMHAAYVKESTIQQRQMVTHCRFLDKEEPIPRS